MGLRPPLGANLAAVAIAAAPKVLPWPLLLIMITTMMMGANAHGAGAGFQYQGTDSLEFFLAQARVRAADYRRRELPLANAPQWRDPHGADVELTLILDNPQRPPTLHQAVWDDLSRHAYKMIVPLIPYQHASILVGVPPDDGVALGETNGNLRRARGSR